MIKKITTTFFAILICSMVIMQPLQVANATVPPPSPSTNPTSIPSNNVIAIQCSVPLTIPYYTLDLFFDGVKLKGWTEIIKSVILFSLAATNDGVISEHNAIAGTVITVILTIISAALFVIGFAQAAGKLADAATLGLGTVAKVFAAKIAFGISVAAIMGCPPVVMNNEQKNWFKTGIPENEGPQKTLLDQNFVTESDCLARIDVDLHDLTDGGGIGKNSWGDITSFPTTKYPPDYGLLEGAVIYENNFLKIAESFPPFIGGYDSSTTTLKIPPGKHDVLYKGQTTWAVLESQKNPLSQKFLVKDIVAPNFKEENLGITIPTLEPLFPKGAPVPISLEQKIKDRVVFEDPCTDDSTIPLIYETNLLSPLDNTNAGIFVPAAVNNLGFLSTGTHEVTVIATDHNGNTSPLTQATTITVNVIDTQPPIIFPVADVGVIIPDGDPSIQGSVLLNDGFPDPSGPPILNPPQLIPPPVTDLASNQPSIKCLVGLNPCADHFFPHGQNTKVTWVVSDPSQLQTTFDQNVFPKYPNENIDPVADPISVSVAQGIPTEIILTASDQDDTNLKFLLTENPTKGSLPQDSTALFDPRFSLTGTLTEPTDVLRKNNGHIFIADAGVNRIIELTGTGDVVNFYDTTPNSPDSFVAENPWNPNPNDIIKIADFDAQEIISYNIFPNELDPSKRAQQIQTLDFSGMNLVNPQSVYEQNDVCHQSLGCSNIVDGLVFVDAKNGGRAVFATTPSDGMDGSLTQDAEIEYSSAELNDDYSPTVTFAGSGTFGENAVILPGAFGIPEQTPFNFPSGAIISDWENQRLTVQTSPIFTGDTLGSAGQIFQSDISELFFDPDAGGPAIPYLDAPIGFTVSEPNVAQGEPLSFGEIVGHIPAVPNFSLGNAGGKYSEAGGDLWDGQLVNGKGLTTFNWPGFFDLYSNSEGGEWNGPGSSVELSWSTGAPITLKSFDVDLLFKEGKRSHECLGANSNCARIDGQKAQRIHNEPFTIFGNGNGGVFEVRLLAQNIESGIWEIVDRVFPPSTYPNVFKGGVYADGTRQEKYGGARQLTKSYFTWSQDMWREYKGHFNVYPVTAQNFKLQLYPYGTTAGVAEIDGWGIYHPQSGNPTLSPRTGSYTISILDKTSGEMVDVSIGENNFPTVATFKDENPFLGINFAQIDDIDVDSNGNIFVNDGTFMYKYDLAGKLLKRIKFDDMFEKETLGNQLFIDKSVTPNKLRFVLQESDVFQLIDPNSILLPSCGFGQPCPPPSVQCQIGSFPVFVNGEWKCEVPPSIEFTFDTNLNFESQKPIPVVKPGKVSYDQNGNVFLAGTLEKRDSDFENPLPISFSSGNECTDTVDISADLLACDILDSAIDSNGNWYLLTPKSVWKYNNDGSFAGRVGIENLQLGFRLEIDPLDNFFIIDKGPSIKKFSPLGELVSHLPTGSLLENFQQDADLDLPEPDPNNLRITSGTNPQAPSTELILVSEGPPLERVHVFDTSAVGSLGDSGVIIYTSIDFMPPLVSDESETDQLTYAVLDPFGARNTATVDITILPDVTTPVIVQPIDLSPYSPTNSGGPTNVIYSGINHNKQVSIEIFEERQELANLIQTIFEDSYKQQTGNNIPEKMLSTLKSTATQIAEQNIPYNPPRISNVGQGVSDQEIHLISNNQEMKIFNAPELSLYDNVRNFFGMSLEPEINSKNTQSFDSKENPPSTVFVGVLANSCFSPIARNANALGGLETDDDLLLQKIIELITVEDDLDPNPSLEINMPTFLPIGSNEVQIRTEDGTGNSFSCTWEIIVEDNVPPVLTIDSVTKEHENELTEVILGNPTVEDFDLPNNITITNDASLDPPQFPVGNSIVTWTAVDSSGNEGTVDQQVIISDGTPPVITPPPDDILIPAINGYRNIVQYDIPEATDTGGLSTSLLPSDLNVLSLLQPGRMLPNSLNFPQGTEELSSVICNPLPGTALPIGTFLGGCTAIDKASNSHTEYFDIVVFAADDDYDGIRNIVDTEVSAHSDDFDDIGIEGLTSGSILERGGQYLNIIDAPIQDRGLYILAATNDVGINDDLDCFDISDPTLRFVDEQCFDIDGIILDGLKEDIDEDPIGDANGDGNNDDDGDGLVDEDPGIAVDPEPSQIMACNDSTMITLDEGDAVSITCGSVTIGALVGNVEGSINLDEQTVIETKLDAPNSLRIDQDEMTVFADADNSDDAVIQIGEKEFSIPPGVLGKITIDSDTGASVTNQNIQVSPSDVLFSFENSHNLDEVVIPSNDVDLSTIQVPPQITNPKINLKNLVTNNVLSGLPEVTINNQLTIEALTSDIPVDIIFPSGVTITGENEWKGIVNLPTIKSTTLVSPPPAAAGTTNTVTSVIELGFDNTELTFDIPVQAKFAGKAGELIAYTRDGVTTEITSICAGNTLDDNLNLPAGGDCKISVGNDLFVWLKHFTLFSTSKSSKTPSSGIGGSSGISTGGGGGGGGGGGASSSISGIGDKGFGGTLQPYKLYQVNYDVCDEGIATIVVGSHGDAQLPDLSIRTSSQGLKTAILAAQQPFEQFNSHNPGYDRYLYEVNLGILEPGADFFYITINAVSGRDIIQDKETVKVESCHGTKTFSSYAKSDVIGSGGILKDVGPSDEQKLFVAPKALPTDKSLTGSFQGTSFELSYTLESGLIEKIDVEELSATLILALDDTKAGDLILTLPNGLIENPDVVWIDGVQIEIFDSISKEGYAILTIPITEGASEVAIMGTSVVPEFGATAAIIFIVLMAGIIAITRKRNQVMLSTTHSY